MYYCKTLHKDKILATLLGKETDRPIAYIVRIYSDLSSSGEIAFVV